MTFPFALPVNGAGQLVVSLELTSGTKDPSAANNKASVQAELRASP